MKKEEIDNKVMEAMARIGTELNAHTIIGIVEDYIYDKTHEKYGVGYRLSGKDKDSIDEIIKYELGNSSYQ